MITYWAAVLGPVANPLFIKSWITSETESAFPYVLFIKRLTRPCSLAAAFAFWAPAKLLPSTSLVPIIYVPNPLSLVPDWLTPACCLAVASRVLLFWRAVP